MAGEWVPSPRPLGPAGAAAVAGATASWRLRPAPASSGQPRPCVRTDVSQLWPTCPGAAGSLLRAALSGQTAHPLPRHLGAHVLNKPMTRLQRQDPASEGRALCDFVSSGPAPWRRYFVFAGAAALP